MVSTSDSLSIHDCRIIDSTFYKSENSVLYTYNDEINIPNYRIFIVKNVEKTKRGCHAHKEAKQWFICTEGSIKVIVFDGYHRKIFLLSDPTKALFIPDGIWSEQYYNENSCLVVLTDKEYIEQDYIREMDNYLSYRGIK